jgi:hypothetical protein
MGNSYFVLDPGLNHRDTPADPRSTIEGADRLGGISIPGILPGMLIQNSDK